VGADARFISYFCRRASKEDNTVFTSKKGTSVFLIFTGISDQLNKKQLLRITVCLENTEHRQCKLPIEEIYVSCN
jgi:RNA-binding protein YhbY